MSYLPITPNRRRDAPSRLALHVVVFLCAFPLAFLLSLLGCGAVRFVSEAIAVRSFLTDNESQIAELRSEPSVHSLEIGLSSPYGSKLKVEGEVDDADTYYAVEELVGEFRHAAMWNVRLRSDEALGNDFGSMAYGISSTMTGIRDASISAAIAVVVALAVGWRLTFSAIGKRTKRDRASRITDQIGSGSSS